MTESRTVTIDLVDPRLWSPGSDAASDVAVLVEPIYDCVAVAAALDAGWDAVELAARSEGDGDPIPLVSFEQPPAAGQTRCRLRCITSHSHLQPGMLLGAPALARPLGALLASAQPDRIALLPVPTISNEVAASSWWACGMLIRVLLDELEQGSRLTDAAGIAVTLATGAEDPRVQLSGGSAWAAHLAAGGNADDLRVASAVDSLGVVPRVEAHGDLLVARPWRPWAGGQPGS